MTDNEQLIAQARDIHAKAMNCSDLASEGAWVAREAVLDPPLHNYWNVTATRTPRLKAVQPRTVTKALTQEPAVAGLLTFVSTALPQLCDMAERAQAAEARILSLEADKRRLDWLELHTVEVRCPLVHGSRHLFFANPDDSFEGEERPSDIRAKIDATQSKEPGDAE